LTDPRLLKLLRIVDSGAPVGAFAHSGGIESLASRGRLGDPDQFVELLRAHRTLSLDRCEAWFAKNAYRANVDRDAERLADLGSQELSVRPASAQRSASLMMGRSLLDLGASIGGSKGAEEAVRWIADALGERTAWSTVFGALTAAFAVPEEEVAGACVYAAVSAQVSAAVRIGLLGAEASVSATAAVMSEPISCPEEWSNFAPLIDTALMQHEFLGGRHFAS
jgi:urease accessory protein